MLQAIRFALFSLKEIRKGFWIMGLFKHHYSTPFGFHFSAYSGNNIGRKTVL